MKYQEIIRIKKIKHQGKSNQDYLTRPIWKKNTNFNKMDKLD